jgi:hypothetical protein
MHEKQKVDNSVPDIAVVDSHRLFLGYTRRGKARKLVREGKARWLQIEPPVLMYTAKPPETIRNRKESKIMSNVNPVKAVTNWTEFFKDPRDLYVQNISTYQVSIEFEPTPGNKVGFLFPIGRDPINLTQHIPFEAVRSSVDFRKMLNRRPPALALLTEEEYMEYFHSKANRDNKPVESVIDQASEKLQKLHNKQEFIATEKPRPLHKVVEDDPHFGGKKRVVSTDDRVAVDEIIHPRVLHLCQQVHHDIPDEQKMRASAMLDELTTLSEQLKIDDLEYIRSHGYYKVVKNFARDNIAKMVGDEGEGAEDTL